MNPEERDRRTRIMEDALLDLQVLEGRLGRRLETPFVEWDADPDLTQATWEWPENRWSSADNAHVAYFSHDALSELVKERLYGYPPGEFRVAIGLQGT